MMQPSDDRLSTITTGHHVRRIALTGGIATGKTHVLDTLTRAGVPTLDTDAVARLVVVPGSEGLSAVTARFGASILQSDGTLDRRALGEIVFKDADARHALEAIIHPLVRSHTERWFHQQDAAGSRLAVVAIPLLYEIGRDRDFHAVIVTTCTPQSQLRRLMSRDTLTEDEARSRIAAQLPLDEKVRRADYVIDTEGPFAATEAQVQAVLAQLQHGYPERP